MTLQEYLEDYASPATKAVGDKVVEREIKNVPNETTRKLLDQYLDRIIKGERDFKF